MSIFDDPKFRQPSKEEIDNERLNLIDWCKMGNNICMYQPSGSVVLSETDMAIGRDLGSLMQNNQLKPEDIKQLGGEIAIFEYSKRALEAMATKNGYIQQAAHRYSGPQTIMGFIDKMHDQKLRDSVEMTSMRKSALEDLYKTAKKLVKCNSNEIENMLVPQTNLYRQTPIEVGGEKPYVELLDIYTATQLARLTSSEAITDKDIQEAGGIATVIHGMSGDAKVAARAFGVKANLIPTEAWRYINTDKSIKRLKAEKQEEKLH